ncbi:hypothetical protein Pmani_025131 [Petrolisthes manimaculis]|uniref:Olfactomedin-like domain-containing protein n=1 Tax=Petrolisthes manimaculis TaxID=1843537 RepID=A0AAE1P8J8_9EUCA|nr:hypothetical protein Pmani_025131 [Petrolisthes manimaculis]
MAFNNNLYGNFFMAYGVLYVLDSATDLDTRIRIAFDLYKGEIEDVDLPFNNPFSYTTLLGYNFKAKMLFSWDKGNVSNLTCPIPTCRLLSTSRVQVTLCPTTIHFK